MDAEPDQPPPGKALSYVDYSGNELGTAAFLSGDPLMMEATNPVIRTPGLQFDPVMLRKVHQRNLILKCGRFLRCYALL